MYIFTNYIKFEPCNCFLSINYIINMRRKDREIHDPDLIHSILANNTVCRIAITDIEAPYIVPLNYGYSGNQLYFHSAPEGRKIELLKKNKFVCFEIEEQVEVIEGEKACDYTTHYRSVIGYGSVDLVSDFQEVKEGLDIIMRQHGRVERNEYNEKYRGKILILKLRIVRISCKQNGNW
jgi:uncharacterized protein